jgi:hypothetical protein
MPGIGGPSDYPDLAGHIAMNLFSRGGVTTRMPCTTGQGMITARAVTTCRPCTKAKGMIEARGRTTLLPAML